jgi:hypothetical protein
MAKAGEPIIAICGVVAIAIKRVAEDGPIASMRRGGSFSNHGGIRSVDQAGPGQPDGFTITNVRSAAITILVASVVADIAAIINQGQQLTGGRGDAEDRVGSFGVRPPRNSAFVRGVTVYEVTIKLSPHDFFPISACTTFKLGRWKVQR